MSFFRLRCDANYLHKFIIGDSVAAGQFMRLSGHGPPIAGFQPNHDTAHCDGVWLRFTQNGVRDEHIVRLEIAGVIANEVIRPRKLARELAN